MSFILNNWPLAFVCAAMIVAAVIDGWKLKVPNWLTFPLVLSGWLLGLLHNFDLLTESTGTPAFTSAGSLPSNSTTSRGRPKYPRVRDIRTTAPAPASAGPNGRAARRCTISDERGNGER